MKKQQLHCKFVIFRRYCHSPLVTKGLSNLELRTEQNTQSTALELFSTGHEKKHVSPVF